MFDYSDKSDLTYRGVAGGAQGWHTPPPKSDWPTLVSPLPESKCGLLGLWLEMKNVELTKSEAKRNNYPFKY